MLNEPILNFLLKGLDITSNSSFMDLIKINPIDAFNGTLWSTMLDIYRNVTLPIGVGLMVIFFLINLIERQVEVGTEMNLQTMMKPIMGFVLGLAIMFGGVSGGGTNAQNNADVVTAITKYGHGITMELANYLGDTENNSQDQEEILKGINKFTKPGFAKIENGEIVVDKGYKLMGGMWQLISAFPMWALAGLGNVYVMWIVYGRLFEIYVRMAVAPIAMADMFVKGAGSTGYRFLKEFGALVIQGFLIILVVKVFSLVQLDSIAGDISFLTKSAMFVAQLSMLGRTKSLAKSALGVN